MDEQVQGQMPSLCKMLVFCLSCSFFCILLILKCCIKIYYTSKSCLRGMYLTLGLALPEDSLGSPDPPHLPFPSPEPRGAEERVTVYISLCLPQRPPETGQWSPAEGGLYN